MIVLLAFKTELDLNNAQKTACTQHAGAARWATNWGPARKIEAHNAGQKVSTAIDACGEGVRPFFKAALDEAGTEPRSTLCRFV